MPATHRPRTVAALMLAMFMSAMEATVVGTAMPTIVAELGGLGLIGWLSSAYLLAATVSVPLYGKLADLYGRRPLLLFGIALFLVGSIGCGASRSMHALIVWRALQGLGAGATQPIALTVIGDLYDVRERGKVQGWFGAIWGVSGVAGPLLGGVIVQHLSWPWVFFINLPVGAASAVLLLASLHEPVRAPGPVHIDWLGAVSIALGSLGVLLGASGFHATSAIGLGALFLVGFVAVERRARDPLLPLSLIGDRAVAVASLSAVLLGATLVSTINFVPLHVQGVLGAPPASAGSVIAPMLVGWPIAATITSRLVLRTGFRGPVIVGSWIAAAALLGFVQALHHHADLDWLRLGAFVYGVGMGLNSTSLMIAIQSSVGREQRGTATATNLFARNMGGALGMGALGALFAALLGGALAPEQVNALLHPELRHGAAAVGDARLVAALEAAIGPVLDVVVVLAVVNLVVVAFYPRTPPPDAEALPPSVAAH
jgi:EmrB/QacA subfamily drug resistance transporter